MQRKPNIDSSSLDSFILGAKDAKLSDQISKSSLEDSDSDKLRRQTYYITNLYIEAIDQMAFYEDMSKYEIVMNALMQYIPDRYIELAKQKKISMRVNK
ncbi:MAG: hypothetical protein ACM3TR_01040 [Caulobacteraceae bacterium]